MNDFKKPAWLVVILLLIIIIVLIVYRCCKGPQQSPCTQALRDSCCKETEKSGADAAFVNNQLYKLRLRLVDYLDLRNAPGPGPDRASMIVLQFVYEKNSTMPVTLKAYSARPNHKFNNTNVVSRYLEAFEVVNFSMPARAIFGDQQVRFTPNAGQPGLDNFLRAAGVNPDNPTAQQLLETELIFTPVLDADGEHIRYNICIIKPNHCPMPGTPTQPSPPADANP